MIDRLKNSLQNHPGWKRRMIGLIEKEARPRLWVRLLWHPFLIRKGRGAVIRSSVRRDLFPYNPVSVGSGSVVESRAVLNNGVGALSVGDRSRIGVGSVLIGPVLIGNDVHLAPYVVLSGLNHRYRDAERLIIEQGVSTAPIVIEDDVWIGTHAVVCPGVTVGRHSVVGAGSVVVRDVPPGCVVAGNPAKIVRRYDASRNEWRTDI